MNITALLQCLQPQLSRTDVRRMSRIVQALLSMTGRVTMLGLSRWAGPGGSYRTVQRFFNSDLPWLQLFGQFFVRHLYRPAGEYFLVGDESVITKSGKVTYGLDYFFAGLFNKVVKSIAIFSLALVSVEERCAYPLQVAQVVRTAAEKAAAQARKTARAQKLPATPSRQRGRPKGSKNRAHTPVALSPELLRIQQMLKKQLALLKPWLTVRHLALDGHFGNHMALQMAQACGLHLISKLRYDAALYFEYTGVQKPRGPRRKYGAKIIAAQLPARYCVAQSVVKGIETRIYQLQVLQREFAQPLNVVIITKTRLSTGALAQVNLFSSDLDLTYEKLIDFYSLRFQIEFSFREAKQYWGLEDFMNVAELPLTNALNLALFMDNVSQALLHEFRQTHPDSGVLDLKTYFRAAKYVEETLKMLPQKPEPILVTQLFDQLTAFGCIHPVNVPVSAP